MPSLIDFFDIKDLIHQGYGLSWSPVLLWLPVIPGLLITLACYSIPLMLVYVIRQRKDFPYPWLIALFAGCIVACGILHLLSTTTSGIALYWLDGLLKAFTMMLSVATAVLMLWIIPRALSPPSAAQLRTGIRPRKTAETAQQETLEKLQQVAGRIPGLVYQYRLYPDGRCCFPYASAAIRDIYRLSPEDVREDGSKIFALLHPDDLDGVWASIHKSAQDLTSWRYEYRVKFNDGTVRWLFGSALPEREADGCTLWHGLITDISGHTQMEEKLCDSDAFNAGILNSLTSQIAILDAQGVIVAVNNAWRQFAKDSGMPDTIQNMPGFNYLDACETAFNHPYGEQANAAQAGIATVLAGKQETFHLEYPCHSPDQQRWFRLNVSPLQHSSGGALVSHENITERKLIENELKADEAKFRLIIDASPVPIALHDENLNITFLNPAFVQTFGYSLDDIPTLADWRQKAHPDPGYRNWVKAAWQTKRKKAGRKQTDFPSLEMAVRCKNNSIKTVLTTAAAINLDVTGLHLVMLYDISRRKQIEAKLDAIFNASVEGIITFDRSDIITSTNATVETIFGYKPEELVGCNINKLIALSPRTLNDCSLPRAVKPGGQIQEIEGLHKNGSLIPLDLSMAEYSIDNTQYFTYIVRNVSARKHREQQNKEHLDQLAHVTRLGLMAEMVSGIAHEINQPLAAISSYTQVSLNLMHTENPDLLKLTEILSKTQRQALRAGQIIHRMREFVKSHVKHRSTVDLNTLIQDAADLCMAELKQNDIKLTFELENHLPAIYIDRIQIEQVIINLLRNSIDALLNLPEKQQRQITIQSCRAPDNAIQVRVIDNGQGLDEDQQQEILMPFYTTKANGMGMGLSISRSLIEAHDGKLHFNSEPGKGSVFYFNLPIQGKSDERK